MIVKIFNAVVVFTGNFFYGAQILCAAPLADGEQRFLRFADDGVDVAAGFVSKSGNITCGSNQTSARGSFFDKFAVGGGVVGGGGQGDESGQVGGAPDLVKLSPLLKFILSRQQINRRTMIMQIDEHIPNPLMLDGVKIIGFEELGNVEK